MTTIVFFGSRTVTDQAIADRLLDRAHAHWPDATFLSGGAAGADTLMIRWATAHDIPHRVMPAEWKRFGRSAGMRRNEQMAAEGDVFIGISHNNSPGTAHMANTVRALGKTLYLATLDNDGQLHF